MFEVLILSATQGITEFLPVSSSSHLIIIGKLLNISFSNLILDISLHVGSFFAVIIYFRSELINFIKNKKLFLLVCISSLPVMIFGFLLIKFNMLENLRSVQLIGWTTIIFGILLYIADKNQINKKIDKDFNLIAALIIGFIHMISIIPGVSRSGIAITGARFIGFDRIESTKISFLLSIPTLFIVSIYGFYSLYKTNNLEFSQVNLMSIILSFIFSYLTIKYFLVFLKKFSFTFFVVYRLLLGIIFLIYVS